MYINSGYDHDTDLDTVRSDVSLSVNSCGHYRLIQSPMYATVRPSGRHDYQLLYIASGQADFRSESRTILLREGQIYLYRPEEPQDYFYRLDDHPDVYWLHFTGTEAARYTHALHGCTDVGIREEYIHIFDHIIRELQLKREGYAPLCAAYMQELFLLMLRYSKEPDGNAASRSRQIEAVIERMHEEIADTRSLEEYAKMCHMGVCWFIRSFRAYTGLPPRQFLIRLKINKARELLSYTSYNVGEIAAMVGYENPLYFSRIFSQNMGCSPSQYRAQNHSQAEGSGS